MTHQTDCVDSEGASKASKPPYTPKPLKPLSDSLSVSVEACAPRYVLGPELYEEAHAEIFKGHAAKALRTTSGVIHASAYNHPFLFRDEKARAWYVFQNINGLVWPCTLVEFERKALQQEFEDGWASGELEYLAETDLKNA